jgi:hypothetical protein
MHFQIVAVSLNTMASAASIHSGKFPEAGLTFASVTYHVLVLLLKLQLMETVTEYWHNMSRKEIMAVHHLTA